jgi:hypothetical protein
MKQFRIVIWGVLSFALLLLSACNVSEAEPTLSAVSENIESNQESPVATNTPSPTRPLSTPLPTSTTPPTPANLYTPTFTATPTPTPSPLELTQAAELALTPSPTTIPTSTPPTPSQPDYLTLIGQIGGYTGAVAVQGNLAFLGVGPRLLVFDVSNPTQPQAVGQSAVLSDVIQALAILNGHVFIVTDDNLLHILNISDTSNPQVINSFESENARNYWSESMALIVMEGPTN